MKNVFLIHGSIGKPFENWFPWLENELSKKSVRCVIPSFPTPEHQNYMDWERLMNYYCDMGIVNEDTIIIGHSCGSVFTTHYLIKNKKKVFAFLSFSGYNNFISGYEFMDNLNESFYMKYPSLDLTEYAKKVFAYFGDDDPNIPQNYLNEFAIDIGAQKISCVKGAGHFNAAAGFDKCELALGDVLSLVNQ